jgi:hypothetical protein
MLIRTMSGITILPMLPEHGETPLGVDLNAEEGQILRLEQLCKVKTGFHPLF